MILSILLKQVFGNAKAGALAPPSRAAYLRRKPVRAR
jgi:hypothetical protein